MGIDLKAVEALEPQLDPTMLERTGRAVDRIVEAKERGGKVAVVTGSGPNVHEGVTTLIGELMRVGVIDAVTTSSAVVSHEMGGTLDRVKRCPGSAVDVDAFYLPRGGEFELTELDDAALAEIAQHVPVDLDLVERLRQADGKSIIKAAGNLGYPMGLWIEHLACEIGSLARIYGATFEEVAGLGADERTMIGVGAAKGLPVLVTIPQLIGGGLVGLNIGDSISITERASRLARMLAGADVIIESGVALTQEVHDGPFERYTGHGLWSAWHGHFTYSLEGKSLVRIDLDPALEVVYQAERGGSAVQKAIADGLPKTKLFKVPFRMEMSGFARHEGSIPIVGDLGVVWPILARRVAERLGIALDYISYPQQSEQGKAMRDAIVREVKPLSRQKMLRALEGHTFWNPCAWRTESLGRLGGAFPPESA
ncbi:MAG TPA: hypothetical protein PLO37_16250 [Candidatus Hydrogenedentes bacterium]|nr:hypothetical protein [Candidatus Hydrogenedentota bacterium]HPG68398.1 hypothetical protein [Candidatus Hydrogenedentota bacterium]